MTDAYTTTSPATEPFLEGLRRAAAFVASGPVPPRAARDRLRIQMAGVLAAALSAPDSAIDGWARRAVGPHPLVGGGAFTARLEAIIGSLARVRARDDDELALVGRPAVAAIVPIVLGAPGDVPWSEVEAAQVAGAEIGLRAGLATFSPAREPCAVAALGAAASTARLLRLDAQATSAALLRASGHRGCDYGEAAVAGVVAAELAYEGHRESAENERYFDARAFADVGRTWLSEAIHPREHAAPSYAQTAIDAGREVAAQARMILGRPLSLTDVVSVEVETTAIGAANATALVRHASSAMGIGRANNVQVKHAWELTSALVTRVLDALAEPQVAIPLATRIGVLLTNGARLRSERSTARGAQVDGARTLARERLRRLGRSRLAELVLNPPRSLRVSEVLAEL